MKTLARWWPACLLLAGGCVQQPREPALATPAAAEQAGTPGVSTVQPATAPGRLLYLCDGGQAVVVQDEGDSIRVSGLPRGEERLDRDAGGVTPQQAVFSGPTLRVELGHGVDGRDMLLQSLQPPEQLHCRRQ